MYTKVLEDQNPQKYCNGASLSEYLLGCKYSHLVKAFGEPTFAEPSGDGKVQKEWVFKDADGNGFTIYDWKTYDESYTLNTLAVWNVGSKVDASSFIVWIEQQLKMDTPGEEYNELLEGMQDMLKLLG